MQALKSEETDLDCRKVHKDEIGTVISALQRNSLSREYSSLWHPGFMTLKVVEQLSPS